MKCHHYTKVEATVVDDPKADGVKKRLVIGPEDETPNFAMRIFTVEPGGHTPLHEHPFEHEIFFIEGEAEVFCNGKNKKAKPGFVAYAPPNVPHRIRNAGKDPLVFLCMVPNEYA